MAAFDLDRQSSPGTIAGIVLAGLAMSVGWGFRGDYGHEAGAMVPGALLGLAVCIGSGRADWWRRASIMGMCGAIGWAFGGQMSYGKIIGYTASSSLLDVLYGYACLFLIGGLWAGIGSAILAMSVTQSRLYLEQFARPLIVLGLTWFLLHLTGLTDRLAGRWSLHDTDWVGASSALMVSGVCAVLFPRDRGACAMIAALAAGWWAGYLVLVGLLGLHMTPPRSDNWAGCVGLFAALLVCLLRRRDRTAVMLAGWGFLIGGVGFVLGDFVNMLGRAQWGPIGRHEALHGLDYWKWMEQGFGLIMGLGVGAVFLQRVRTSLSTPPEDSRGKRLTLVSFLLLLVVMMWANLSKNVANWIKGNHIPQEVLGMDSTGWFLAIGLLLSAVAAVAIVRQYRGRLTLAPASEFGRAQMLFLIVLWVPVVGAFMQALPGLSGRGVFLVQASFWITAALCSLILVNLTGEPRPGPAEPGYAFSANHGDVMGGSAKAAGLGDGCTASREGHRQASLDDATRMRLNTYGPRRPSDACWRLGWRYWACLCLVPILLYVAAYLTLASHDGPLPGRQTRFSRTAVAEPVSTRP